jgi:hypothetical protein
MVETREEKVTFYAKIDLANLEKLRDHYEARQDSYTAGIVRDAMERHGSVQTQELYNSGKLFRHRNVDPYSGRVTYRHTGDPMAWMKDFMDGAGPIGCRLDSEQFTGRNSPSARAREAATVRIVLQPGERVQIVKDAAE